MSDPAKTSQNTSATPADAEGAAPSGRAYAAFEHSWTDRWADTEVAVSYRFAKPSPTHIKRLQSTAARNPAQASRALILDESLCVWLDADVATLVGRVGRRSHRPLLKDRDPGEVLRELAAVRNPVYAEAHIRVSSASNPHEHTVRAILEALSQWKPQ